MRYARSDVVIVPFPFTDQSATKTRPAVVIHAWPSATDYDYLICLVSTKLRP